MFSVWYAGSPLTELHIQQPLRDPQQASRRFQHERVGRGGQTHILKIDYYTPTQVQHCHRSNNNSSSSTKKTCSRTSITLIRRNSMFMPRRLQKHFTVQYSSLVLNRRQVREREGEWKRVRSSITRSWCWGILNTLVFLFCSKTRPVSEGLMNYTTAA